MEHHGPGHHDLDDLGLEDGDIDPVQEPSETKKEKKKFVGLRDNPNNIGLENPWEPGHPMQNPDHWYVDNGDNGFWNRTGNAGWQHGRVTYDTGDMYVGYIDLSLKPWGPGTLYRWKDGDCWTGRFVSKNWEYPRMVGEGVRFTPHRDEAERMHNGEFTGEYMTCQEAMNMLDLKDFPPEWGEQYTYRHWAAEHEEIDLLPCTVHQGSDMVAGNYTGLTRELNPDFLGWPKHETPKQVLNLHFKYMFECVTHDIYPPQPTGWAEDTGTWHNYSSSMPEQTMFPAGKREYDDRVGRVIVKSP